MIRHSARVFALSILCSGIFFAAPLLVHAADKDKKEDKSAPPAPPPPAGEFVCEAEVFFSWVPQPPKLPVQPPSPGAPPPGTAPSPGPPIEESFAKARVSGISEVDARANLLEETTHTQHDASEQCAKRHERLGDCISARILSMGADYVTLDFETRRMLRDQYKVDCERAVGTCTETRVGDVTCQATVAPPPPAPAEPPPGEKKKK